MIRYLKIFLGIIFSRLGAELSFRVSFFAGIFGSFNFIAMYILTLLLLMPHVRFGVWGQKEMWLLLGVFLIFCYGVFFIFWRGLMRLPQNIRTAQLDFMLTKPIDSQFIVSIQGGGVHNFLAIIFGIAFTIFAVINLGLTPNIWQILFTVVTILVSILNFYNFAFFLAILNFQYGYLGESTIQIFELQSFSRYPAEAFSGIPWIAGLIVLPFSLLTTIPAKILLDNNFSLVSVLLYLLVSIGIAFLVRKFWFHELKHYSSASS